MKRPFPFSGTGGGGAPPGGGGGADIAEAFYNDNIGEYGSPFAQGNGNYDAGELADIEDESDATYVAVDADSVYGGHEVRFDVSGGYSSLTPTFRAEVFRDAFIEDWNMRLDIWDDDDASWEQLDTSSSSGVQELSGSPVGTLSNYVDSNDEVVVRVWAIEILLAGTDYIRLMEAALAV